MLVSCFLLSQVQSDIKISEIVGIWQSNTGSSFEIINTDEGFKICPTSYKNSWSYYKPDNLPNFLCYKVSGKYRQNFIGSKISIQDSKNIRVYYNSDGKTYYWKKQQNYNISESGELFVGGNKINHA
jgi:hypothetical protein